MKRIDKKIVGIAGIHCSCCNAYHKGRSMKATKTILNRRARRKMRMEQIDIME